jgi:hypothetical protein
MYEDKHYRRWVMIVREALSCMDVKHNCWYHLPCNGGYYDQDDFIMVIWEYIRYCVSKAGKDPEIIKELNRQAEQRNKKNG